MHRGVMPDPHVPKRPWAFPYYNTVKSNEQWHFLLCFIIISIKIPFYLDEYVTVGGKKAISTIDQLELQDNLTHFIQ